MASGQPPEVVRERSDGVAGGLVSCAVIFDRELTRDEIAGFYMVESDSRPAPMDFELAGQKQSVHRARASERHQHEFAWVQTLLDGDGADRIGHVRVHYAAYAFGEHVWRQPQLRSNSRQRRFGRADIELHAAAEACLGVDSPEDQVGVRDCRLESTPSVARRARIGPSAARTDP